MEVLESKCNVCHARRNPSRVFTEENMDAYGSSIYEQVFVRKRMPRGSSIRLSEQESNALKNWLNTLK
ncbi:hypothetical protein [Reichenbachiella ulvae]|uniref:Haem-binding domain-containing protein n=1 Tax=Reichenbachiella ulvae TaxID=2980104 RepID=A0ABT3CVQ2_9BACT|nr:hypothetical protein [Reichenbachiella ulvae]MCV9387638.1 hypothetical protein [Reichenbachiella ulvae]